MDGNGSEDEQHGVIRFTIQYFLAGPALTLEMDRSGMAARLSCSRTPKHPILGPQSIPVTVFTKCDTQ
jgi:hypothetical protein